MRRDGQTAGFPGKRVTHRESLERSDPRRAQRISNHAVIASSQRLGTYSTLAVRAFFGRSAISCITEHVGSRERLEQHPRLLAIRAFRPVSRKKSNAVNWSIGRSVRQKHGVA